MIRISRLVIVGDMTTITGIGRIVVITVVAGRTVIGNHGVCTIQGIVIIMYRKRSRLPARGSRVAHRTISWNTQCGVIRIDRLIKIGGMAARTGIRCIGIITVMAKSAIICNSLVSTG